MEKNLAMPGNPRYQPKDLQQYFGYDNIARFYVEVELAAMETLIEMGVIPAADAALLTREVKDRLLAITTTEVDEIENSVTKHDIRAVVILMQEILPLPLRRWVHVPMTSYDVIDTARALQFLGAHNLVVMPKIARLIGMLRDQAMKNIDQIQIGRTHGQHALPITVGFWFATILSRVLENAEKLEANALSLVGKISGAVGAYNAQIGLGIVKPGDSFEFETKVLGRLGLRSGIISTQIVAPEPLAYYLFSAVMTSVALGQFGRDARNLMRTEIGEIGEPFEKDQVGSSTMAHKRNPINFENSEGTQDRSISEFGKVFATMISEHQRDLVGSSLARDFPTIIVNLVLQLDKFLKADKDGRSFLERVTVYPEACARNLVMQSDKCLAEPLYLMLQMHGYEGDAHKIVNHRAMPMMSDTCTLVEAVRRLSENDEQLRSAWNNIPPELHELLRNSAGYTGLARRKVHDVCEHADRYLRKF